MKEITINDLGSYEIELARYGYIHLIWTTSVIGINKFEIYSSTGKVFESTDPEMAIKRFNELMQ